MNLVVNGLLALLTTIGHEHVGIFGVPLIGAPSLITDTIGTFVILPVTTSLLCSFGVRGYRRRGLIGPIRLPSVGALRWLNALPRGDLQCGAVLAGWTTAVLGPGACGLLLSLGTGGASRGSFVVYKAILGVALGAVITPVVALRAMADRPVPNAAALR